MNLEFPARQKRQLPLPCSPTRPGMVSPAIFLPRPGLSGQSCLEKFLMFETVKTYHGDTEARRKSRNLCVICFFYIFSSRFLIWLTRFLDLKRSCNPDPRRTKFALIRSHSR